MTTLTSPRSDVVESSRTLRGPRGALLRVRPSDIEFWTDSDGGVQISIRVRNGGDAPSDPTEATIEAAPLGVFLPWRPLTRLPVPGIAPGESVELRSRMERPRTRAIAPPGETTPDMVRAALLANAQDSRLVEEDLPPDRDVTAADVRGFQKKRLLRLNPFWRRGLIHTARGVARKGIRPSEPTPRSPAVSLPEDVFDLFGLGHPHWLGNLNVFINRKPVERHLGRALRVYAGQNNLAMFLVGDRRSDRYRFSFGNCPEGWQRALYLPGGRSVAREWCTASSKIHEGDWLPLPGLSTVMLAIRPPAQAGSGEIAVIVEQSSTGQRAQVEFSLDPSAKGAGCYVLD